jgi:hypothetical protein
MVAIVGGVLAFALVRGRDFVTSPKAPAAPEPEPLATAAG